MKYLKLFETVTQYESFKDSSEYVTPNVSLITNVDDDDTIKVVKFNPKEDEPIQSIPNNTIIYYSTEKLSLHQQLNEHVIKADPGIYFSGIIYKYSDSVDGFISGSNLFDRITHQFENGIGYISIDHPFHPAFDYILCRLDKEAFIKVNSMRSIELPESLEEIQSDAFYECRGLEIIKCYAKIAPVIDLFSFYDCDALKTVYHPKGSDYSSWKKILTNVQFIEF